MIIYFNLCPFCPNIQQKRSIEGMIFVQLGEMEEDIRRGHIQIHVENDHCLKTKKLISLLYFIPCPCRYITLFPNLFNLFWDVIVLCHKRGRYGGLQKGVILLHGYGIG